MQKAAKLNFIENTLTLFEKYQSLIRFIIVGCVNTGVDFFVFSALHSFAGVDKLLCQIAGYSMGIINSFIMNKLWTFESTKPSINTTNQIIRFIAINLASLGISLLGLNYFTKYYGLSIYTAKVIVTLMSQAINYMGYKFLVFANR